jgi:RNA polymerase sporulation-specific sigma factor
LPRALTDKEQENLLREYYATRDEGARQLLISHNLRLCAYYANKYAKSIEQYEDLMSVATIELINVIDKKFDITRGNKFSTYATISIIGAITNETHRDIRTKEPLEKHHLSYFNGEIPGVDLESEKFSYDPCDNIIENIAFKDKIRYFMLSLNERERIIARYYHSLLGDKKIPTKVLAKKLGVSTSYVNLIAKQLKEKLRDYLGNNGLKLDPRKEALLNYLKKVTSKKERAIIEHYYGLNDKEKLNALSISRKLVISRKEVLDILNKVNRHCGFIGSPEEVTNEDIKNYLATSRNEVANRIGGYYSNLEGTDKEKQQKTCLGLGLDRQAVYGVIRYLKLKIAKEKLKAEQLEGHPIITMSDILEYYNDDSKRKDKEFMEYLYGLNGKEKKYVKELVSIFNISESTVRKKIEYIESNIIKYILDRDSEQTI